MIFPLLWKRSDRILVESAECAFSVLSSLESVMYRVPQPACCAEKFLRHWQRECQQRSLAHAIYVRLNVSGTRRLCYFLHRRVCATTIYGSSKIHCSLIHRDVFARFLTRLKSAWNVILFIRKSCIWRIGNFHVHVALQCEHFLSIQPIYSYLTHEEQNDKYHFFNCSSKRVLLLHQTRFWSACIFSRKKNSDRIRQV